MYAQNRAYGPPTRCVFGVNVLGTPVEEELFFGSVLSTGKNCVRVRAQHWMFPSPNFEPEWAEALTDSTIQSCV